MIHLPEKIIKLKKKLTELFSSLQSFGSAFEIISESAKFVDGPSISLNGISSVKK